MGHDGRDHVVNETRLKEIYGATMARSQAEHPSPEALLSLARREGSEESRLATLDHAMSCATCRGELDLLRSIEQAGAETGAGRSGGRRAWFVPAALAATVLLAVGIGRMTVAPGGDDDVVRSGDVSTVAVVAPAAEAVVGQPLAFAWRPVQGAVRYRVELMNGGGDIAIEAETRDTTVTIEGVRRLEAGDYRWWVVALTPRPGPRSELRPLRLTAK